VVSSADWGTEPASLRVPFSVGPEDSYLLVTGDEIPPEIIAYYVAYGFDDVTYAILMYQATPPGNYYWYQCAPVLAGAFLPNQDVYTATGVGAGGTVIGLTLTNSNNMVGGEARYLWDDNRLDGYTLAFVGTFGRTANIALGGAFGLETSIDFQITSNGSSISQGRGKIGETFSYASSAAVGPAETVVATIAAQTFEAGRAYQIRYGSRIHINGAGAAAQARIRKTNAAGTVWGQAGGWTQNPGGQDNAAQGYLLVRRTAVTDLVATVVLTLQATAGTVVHGADATTARYLTVVDCGSATEYPEATTIV
jgi:hypothetical protein